MAPQPTKEKEQTSTCNFKIHKKIVNDLVSKALNGRLNGQNTLFLDEDFFKFYNLKDDFKINSNKYDSFYGSLKELSKWISGEKIEGMKEKLGNVNTYLLGDMQGEKRINPLAILNIRNNNLFRKYERELNGKAGTYYEFPLFINTLESVLDSGRDFDFNLSNESLRQMYNDATKKYNEIYENENIDIDEFLKKEAKTIYSGFFKKAFGITIEEAIARRNNYQTNYTTDVA